MDHRIYNFQTACNAHSTIIKEGYILTNQVSVWEEKSDLSLTGPAFLGAKKCWWSFNLLRASCVSCAAYDSCMALGLITTTTCLAQAFPVWDDPHGRKMAPFWLSERNHYHTDNMKQHEWDIVGWHVEWWQKLVIGSLLTLKTNSVMHGMLKDAIQFWSVLPSRTLQQFLDTLIMWWNRHSFLPQHLCEAPFLSLDIMCESQEALHHRL